MSYPARTEGLVNMDMNCLLSSILKRASENDEEVTKFISKTKVKWNEIVDLVRWTVSWFWLMMFPVILTGTQASIKRHPREKQTRWLWCVQRAKGTRPSSSMCISKVDYYNLGVFLAMGLFKLVLAILLYFNWAIG